MLNRDADPRRISRPFDVPRRPRALPCDIVIGVHPGFTDLAGKLKRRLESPASDPFVDPGGCRAYADAASKRLDARIAEEGRTR